MSQVEDEQVCGECDYRCEECTHCARTKPCECGCGFLGGSCQNDEDEAINEDLETISELKRSGSMDDIDEAIELLKRLMLHFSHRTERHGLIDIAESYLMDELIELKNKI
jgi:hypothetical protein